MDRLVDDIRNLFKNQIQETEGSMDELKRKQADLESQIAKLKFLVGPQERFYESILNDLNLDDEELELKEMRICQNIVEQKEKEFHLREEQKELKESMNARVEEVEQELKNCRKLDLICAKSNLDSCKEFLEYGENNILKSKIEVKKLELEKIQLKKLNLTDMKELRTLELLEKYIMLELEQLTVQLELKKSSRDLRNLNSMSGKIERTKEIYNQQDYLLYTMKELSDFILYNYHEVEENYVFSKDAVDRLLRALLSLVHPDHREHYDYIQGKLSVFINELLIQCEEV